MRRKGYQPGSDEPLRILLYGHYRIGYRIKADKEIDILGVFHGALDIDRYFGREAGEVADTRLLPLPRPSCRSPGLHSSLSDTPTYPTPPSPGRSRLPSGDRSARPKKAGPLRGRPFVGLSRWRWVIPTVGTFQCAPETRVEEPPTGPPPPSNRVYQFSLDHLLSRRTPKRRAPTRPVSQTARTSQNRRVAAPKRRAERGRKDERSTRICQIAIVAVASAVNPRYSSFPRSVDPGPRRNKLKPSPRGSLLEHTNKLANSS